MPDTRVYKAGEEITATLTLEEGHEPTQGIAVHLNLAQPAQPEPLTNAVSNRIAELILAWQSSTSSPPVDGKYELKGNVPRQIVGGTYKPWYADFQKPEGTQRLMNPDPDGDFVRRVVDDPPTPRDMPVIKDLD